MTKFKVVYSVDCIYQNPGRNLQGRFLDTISMPGEKQVAFVDAIDIVSAQREFWAKYGGTKTIREIYPI